MSPNPLWKRFNQGGLKPPYYSDLLFYSKSRDGVIIENEVGDDAELVIDPTIDIIDLSKWDVQGIASDTVFRTVDFGTPTVPNVYNVIDTAIQLQNINTIVGALSGNYIMSDDINLGISPYNTGEGWLPIGDSAGRFTGVFNGNGFSIKNLYINVNRDSFKAGLFGFIKNAKISNLGIIDCNISNTYPAVNSYTSSLIGLCEGGIIRKCSSSGVVTGYKFTGGFLGHCTKSTTKPSSILNCSSSVTVSGYQFVGGLTGGAYYNPTISNCYSTGNVTGTSYAGGMIGYIYMGAIITNSFWDTQTSGQTTSAGGTGKTTAEMKDIETYIPEWDFDTVWAIDALVNDGYPYLQQGLTFKIFKIVANVDGYVQMPVIAGFGRLSIFNQDDPVIYDQTIINTGNEEFDSANALMWHISELNIATILGYTMPDYKSFFFVKLEYTDATRTVVLNVKEIIAYDRVITDPIELAKIYSYCNYEE